MRLADRRRRVSRSRENTNTMIPCVIFQLGDGDGGGGARPEQKIQLALKKHFWRLPIVCQLSDNARRCGHGGGRRPEGRA